MHPVLFKIGGFVVYSYGTMLAIAIFVSVFLISIKATGSGLKEDIIFSLSFYVMIFSIVGARALYVLLNLREFLVNPLEILMVHHGGLVFYGGLFLGFLGGAFYIRQRKLDLAQILDIIAPYIALGQAIARIGCLLNGCCYGRQIHRGTGLIFPYGSVAGNRFPGEVLYPTQVYSSFIDLGIFLILLEWYKFRKKDGPKVGPLPKVAPPSCFRPPCGDFRKKAGGAKVGPLEGEGEGEIFVGYLLLYSIKRFLIEFIRGDSPKLFVGLNFFQVASLLIGVISFFLLFKIRWKVNLE